MIKKYIDVNELKTKLCFDKRLDMMACGDLRKVLEIIDEVSFSADGKIYCSKRDQVYSKNCICEYHEYKENK